MNQACPKDQNNFPFLVIGNKIDLITGNTPRSVSQKRVQSWMNSKNMSDIYFETSAKRETLVEEAFMKIAKIALDKELALLQQEALLQQNAHRPEMLWTSNAVTLTNDEKQSDSCC